MRIEHDVIRLEDADPFVATVVLAFGADPFVRWLLPDPERFLTFFPEITRLHAQRTAAHGGAYGLRGGRGAAFWYPPDLHPDAGALGAVLEQAGVRTRVAAMFERTAEYEPNEPHWYLRQIGVDPALQRSGAGSHLLEVAFAEIDAQGKVAYLEATSERGVTFYERHGFTVLGEVRVEDSPPLWPMSREVSGSR